MTDYSKLSDDELLRPSASAGDVSNGPDYSNVSDEDLLKPTGERGVPTPPKPEGRALGFFERHGAEAEAATGIRPSDAYNDPTVGKVMDVAYSVAPFTGTAARAFAGAHQKSLDKEMETGETGVFSSTESAAKEWDDTEGVKYDLYQRALNGEKDVDYSPIYARKRNAKGRLEVERDENGMPYLDDRYAMPKEEARKRFVKELATEQTAQTTEAKANASNDLANNTAAWYMDLAHGATASLGFAGEFYLGGALAKSAMGTQALAATKLGKAFRAAEKGEKIGFGLSSAKTAAEIAAPTLANAVARYEELTANDYGINENGDLVLNAEDDGMIRGAAKALGGAAFENVTEVALGKGVNLLVKNGIGGAFKGIYHRCPKVAKLFDGTMKAIGDARIDAAKKLWVDAAKAYAKVQNAAHFEIMPVGEFAEEYVQGWGDEVLGFGNRATEEDAKFGDFTKRFWLDWDGGTKDLFFGIMGQSIALGGGAYASIRGKRVLDSVNGRVIGTLKQQGYKASDIARMSAGTRLARASMEDPRIAQELGYDIIDLARMGGVREKDIEAFADNIKKMNADGFKILPADEQKKVKDSVDQFAEVVYGASYAFSEGMEGAEELLSRLGKSMQKVVRLTEERQGLGNYKDNRTSKVEDFTSRIDWTGTSDSAGNLNWQTDEDGREYLESRPIGDDNKTVRIYREGDHFRVVHPQSSVTQGHRVADLKEAHDWAATMDQFAQKKNRDREVMADYIMFNARRLVPTRTDKKTGEKYGAPVMIANNAQDALDNFDWLSKKDAAKLQTAVTNRNEGGGFKTEDGTVLMLLDNLKDANDALLTLSHEIGGHLAAKEGTESKGLSLVDTVAEVFKGSSRKDTNAYKSERRIGIAEGETKEDATNIAKEEALVYGNERRMPYATPLQRAKTAVKVWLKERGMDAKLTDADFDAIAAAGLQRVRLTRTGDTGTQTVDGEDITPTPTVRGTDLQNRYNYGKWVSDYRQQRDALDAARTATDAAEAAQRHAEEAAKEQAKTDAAVADYEERQRVLAEQEQMRKDAEHATKYGREMVADVLNGWYGKKGISEEQVNRIVEGATADEIREILDFIEMEMDGKASDGTVLEAAKKINADIVKRTVSEKQAKAREEWVKKGKARMRELRRKERDMLEDFVTYVRPRGVMSYLYEYGAGSPFRKPRKKLIWSDFRAQIKKWVYDDMEIGDALDNFFDGMRPHEKRLWERRLFGKDAKVEFEAGNDFRMDKFREYFADPYLTAEDVLQTFVAERAEFDEFLANGLTSEEIYNLHQRGQENEYLSEDDDKNLREALDNWGGAVAVSADGKPISDPSQMKIGDRAVIHYGDYGAWEIEVVGRDGDVIQFADKENPLFEGEMFSYRWNNEKGDWDEVQQETDGRGSEGGEPKTAGDAERMAEGGDAGAVRGEGGRNGTAAEAPSADTEVKITQDQYDALSSLYDAYKDAESRTGSGSTRTMRSRKAEMRKLRDASDALRALSDKYMEVYGKRLPSGWGAKSKDDVIGKNPLILDGGTAQEIAAEQKRIADRKEIERRMATPLKTGKGEMGQTLMDLGGAEGEDLFNRAFGKWRRASKEESARLDKEDTITLYRAMQVIDGKLYPPMAAKIDGKLVDGIRVNDDGSIDDKEWLVSDEPDADKIAEMLKNGQLIESEDGTLNFKLDKGNGKSITARYNPYWHTSNMMLNDQFSEAYQRPNMVVVEVEVPISENGNKVFDKNGKPVGNGAYYASRAKNDTGWTDWHSGTVAAWIGKLGKGRRDVFLSRYCKVVRMIPNGEVAHHVKSLIEGTDVEIPSNVITPSLRKELEKVGVPVYETVGSDGKVDTSSFTRMKKERMSLIPKAKDAEGKAQGRWRRASESNFVGDLAITDNYIRWRRWDSANDSVMEEREGRLIPRADIKKEMERALVEIGMKKDAARKYIRDEQSLAKLIYGDPVLDFDADEWYEPIKKNSDYSQGTVDFDNICRKRRLMLNVFTALQRHFPNKVITAEMLEAMRAEMIKRGMMVACAPCFAEDRRQKMGEVAAMFIKGLTRPSSVKSPLGRGVIRKFLAENKDYKKVSIYDLITLEGAQALRKTDDGRKVYEAFEKFNNARGQGALRLFEGRTEYHGEIAEWTDEHVKAVNEAGGLRFFSFSDFEAANLFDIVKIVRDCAIRGVKIQAYTKVPAFAKLIAKTGIKCNRSFIAKGDGLDDNGNLVWDTIEGIDPNDKDFIAANDDIGNTTIGINDAFIRAAMVNDLIDQLIPFHTGIKKSILAKKNIAHWVNYRLEQREKKLVDGKWKTGKNENFNVNFYTEVLGAYDIANKFDFVNRFLEVCAKKGLQPRFSRFLNTNGKWTKTDASVGRCDKSLVGTPRYVYNEGYHKLLVDYKMFDKNGNLLPQRNVKPDFDLATMKKMIEEYRKENEGLAEIPASESEKVVEVAKKVAKDIGAKWRRSAVTPAEDAAYLDAVRRGDMETARKMVREAAAKNPSLLHIKNNKTGDFVKPPKMLAHEVRSMPKEFAKEIGTWDVVSKSPYSNSFYNSNDISWDGKPDGSLRIADHWNFTTFQDQTRHCKTDIPVENNKEWALGKWNAKKGEYEIIKKLPAIGEYTGPVRKVRGFLGMMEVGGMKAGDTNTTKQYIAARKLANGNTVPYSKNPDIYLDTETGNIKSADPVTYDDAGSVIPLSERFNAEKSDIRWRRSGIYTGSAADYDKPSLIHVGTGEGSQVYGWGLYGSDQRWVAEGYAKGGAAIGVTRDGRKVEPYGTDIISSAAGLIGLSRTKEKAIEIAKERSSSAISEVVKKLYSDIAKELETHDYKVDSEKIYEQTFFTNRAEGDESHLLNWYEPVSEENLSRVIEQAKKEGIEYDEEDNWLKVPNGGGYWIAQMDNATTGEKLYHELVNILRNPREVSEFLARADIDGIKYPVDSYGGKSIKDGDKVGWNYVSFRDDNIRVDHKWVDGKQMFRRRTYTPNLAAQLLSEKRTLSTTDVLRERKAAKDGNAALVAAEKLARELAAQGSIDPVLRDLVRATKEGTPVQIAKGNLAALASSQAFSRWREILQDAQIALKEMETKYGIKTDASAYAQFDRNYGLVKDAMDRFYREIYEPLTKKLKDNGVKADDFDEYLRAKHGPERNRMIAERSPYVLTALSDKRTQKIVQDILSGTRDFDDAAIMDISKKLGWVDRNGNRTQESKDFEDDLRGSGATTAHWKNVLAKFDADGLTPKMLGAEKLVRELTKRNRDLLVKTGRLSADQAALWEKLSPNYVPLKSDMEMDSNVWTKFLLGGGADKGGTNGKRYSDREYNHAYGRGTIADSPLSFAIQQYEESLNRAYDNVARQRLAAMVRANPNMGKVFRYLTDTERADLARRIAILNNVAKKRALTAKEQDALTKMQDKLTEANNADKSIPTTKVLGANGIMHEVPTIDSIEGTKQYPTAVIAFKENGELKFIRLGGFAQADISGDPKRNIKPNPNLLDDVTARRIATAVKKQNMAELGEVGKWIRKATGLFSALRTAYSPTFLVSNLGADNTQAMRNIYATFGGKGAVQFEKYAFHAFKAAAATLSGNYGTTKIMQYAKEWAENGGKIGGLATDQIGDLQKKMARDIRRLYSQSDQLANIHNLRDFVAWANDKRYGFADIVEKMNGVVEMSTRIAAYATARDMGQSVNDAVAYSRDITVNFNRKGTASPWLNALYAFSNATMQDLHRSLVAFAEGNYGKGSGILAKRGAVMGFGLVALGLLSSMLGFWQDDPEDEQEGEAQYKNAKEWQKQNVMGIRIGGKTVGVPIRGISRIPYYLGHQIYEAMSGRKSVGRMAADTALLAIENATDFLGQASTPFNVLTPSVLRPAVDIGINKTFTGQQMYREPMINTDVRSEMGRGATSDAAKWIARALNRMTGGNEGKRGLVDVQPEKVAEVWNWIFGSAGKDVANIAGTVKDIATGDILDRPLKNIPYLSRFIRNLDENSARYYEARDAYDTARKEYKTLIALDRTEDAQKVLDENPWLAERGTNKRWGNDLNEVKNFISKLLELEKKADGEDYDTIHAMRLKAQYQFMRRMEQTSAEDREGMAAERELKRKAMPFLRAGKKAKKDAERDDKRRKRGLIPHSR